MKSIFNAIVGLLISVFAFSNAYAETDFKWGASLRFRPEFRNNSDFDSDTYDNEAFIGQRIRLQATAETEKGVTAFIQIQDSRQWGEVSNVNSANETQSLDIYQAYMTLKPSESYPLSAKVGRQALVYGDQRLLGHLGWKDSARSFDALKFRWDFKMVDSDVFYAKLKETDGSPSSSGKDDDLMGMYNTYKPTDNFLMDFYYLYWKNDANRKVSTYGLRFKGTVFTNIDYTAEGVLQSGDWAKDVRQEASAWAVKVGYNMGFFVSRIGLEYDHGSGDNDKTDDKHKNFVFPFHTNHAHYGFMDYFSWGNMNDYRLQVNGKAASIKWQLDYHYLTLDKNQGDWLNVVGTGSDKQAVAGKYSSEGGQEIDMTLKYPYSSTLKMVGGYSVFLPGNAARERKSDNGDTSTWGYLMTVLSI